MSKHKAARLKLHGIDVDKLEEAIRGTPTERHLLNRHDRRKILESIPGCIPDDFRDQAYGIALDNAALAAFQLLQEKLNGGSRQASLYGEVVITEKLPDGATVQVHGIKHIIEGMTDTEYNDFEARTANNIRQQGRNLNAKRMLRNKYANERGFQQRDLPFPEFEA